MNKITKEEAAWLAGIIDGEGSVSITHTKKQSGSQYVPLVQIQMCDRGTLKHIADLYGKIGIDKTPRADTPKNPNHSTAYAVNVSSVGDCYLLTRAIVDYCVTKRRQVELLSEFCARRFAAHGINPETAESLSLRGGDSVHRPPYTDEDETTYRTLKQLNARGNQRQPLANIEWIPAGDLHQNSWNPNAVFDQELNLLEESILAMGWIQPIVVNKNLMIIDGFHRWQLSLNSKRLIERDAQEVPCVILDITDREAMMMTVRINRAKGTHVAFRMSELVQTLVEDYGVTPQEMVTKMGMTKTEVQLLLDGSLLKHHKLEKYRYSKAWVPVETTKLDKETAAKVQAGETFDE